MITNRDRHYIDLCYTAARDLERVAGARVVALIVYKNIHVWGRNQDKTHPLQQQYGRNAEAIYLHAEVDAIRNAVRQLDPDDLRHATLYVARAKWVDGSKREMIYGEARPCSGCQNAIEAFRLKKVVYTTDEQTITEL